MQLEKATIHLLTKLGRNLCGEGYPTFMKVAGRLEINLSSTVIEYVNCPACIIEALRLAQDEMNDADCDS